jgi:hypothetical protein
VVNVVSATFLVVVISRARTIKNAGTQYSPETESTTVVLPSACLGVYRRMSVHPCVIRTAEDTPNTPTSF